MDTKPKTYTMLKTTQGSRDGLTVETFNKGESYELNADLAEQFYHQGAVEEGGSKAKAGHPADSRSAKVTAPAETKVVEPAETKAGEAGVDTDTQHIEELVTVARDHYGLDVDSTMSEQEVRALIDAAEEAHSRKPAGRPKKAKK